MKPSEKLTLIKQIAEKLSREEIGMINLVLGEFNIPVSRTTKLAPLVYVSQRIRSTSAEVLRDLAAHLGIDAAKSSREVGFWRKGAFKVFISHLSAEKQTATELKAELDKYGMSSFVAHMDIKPSKEWHHEIESALSTCDGLIALLVPSFRKSLWTDHEIGFAIGRGVPIVPVNLGTMPYGLMEFLQSCPFENIQDLSRQVFQIFNDDPRSKEKLAHALLHQFEQSDSFARSAENLRLLKRLKYWNPELLERLRQAPRKNNQIKGSFDVPEGVQALAKKIKVKLAK